MIFVLPALSGGNSAVIEGWYRAVGDAMVAGEPLVLVRTPRAVFALPAPGAGLLAVQAVAVGETVEAGATLAEIASEVAGASADAETTPRPRSTPLARKIAAVHGYDLADVAGSGRGGRIVRADIIRMVEPFREVRDPAQVSITYQRQADLAHQDQRKAQPPVQIVAHPPLTIPAVSDPPPHSNTTGPLDVPVALTAVEVKLAAALQYCERESQGQRRGVALTPTICITQAAGNELLHHRLLNGSWSEDGIVLRGQVQLEIVLQGQRQVVADAAALSPRGLARLLADTHATTNPDPTFTIVAAQSVWAEGVLMPQHTATLTIGQATRRIGVQTLVDGDRLAPEVVAMLVLCYDARAMMHWEADAFLRAVKRRVETLV